MSLSEGDNSPSYYTVFTVASLAAWLLSVPRKIKHAAVMNRMSLTCWRDEVFPYSASTTPLYNGSQLSNGEEAQSCSWNIITNVQALS